MIITTTNSLDGVKIEKYLGLVNAIQVISGNPFVSFADLLVDLFSKESTKIGGKLDIYYSQVYSEIREKAEKLGANAVIGLNVEFEEVSVKGKNYYMVTAVGTAIRYFKAISADRYEIFKKLHELKLFFNENLISQEEYEREVALIKNQYENEVENETKFLEEEKAKLRKMKEEEDIKKKEVTEELRKIQEKIGCELNSITTRKSLYGFNIDDVIIIKKTGECTTIDGFTNDNMVVCRLNDEISILDFDEIKLA